MTHTRALTVVGLVLSIVGWLLSSSDDVRVVRRVVTPGHNRAVDALARLGLAGTRLGPSAPGFSEMVDALRPHLEPRHVEIAAIESRGTVARVISSAEGAHIGGRLNLRLHFALGPPSEGNICDLDEQIGTAYRRRIVMLSALVFLFGIIIIAANEFLAHGSGAGRAS